MSKKTSKQAGGLAPGLYRYKGRIYSAAKQYSEEKIPFEIQGREFLKLNPEKQKAITSDLRGDYKPGLTRDSRGRIRRTGEEFIPTEKEIKREQQRSRTKEKILIEETLMRRKRGDKIKTTRILKYTNEAGEERTEADYNRYRASLGGEKQKTKPVFNVYNQSLITYAMDKLSEGGEVFIMVNGKKTQITIKNIARFMKASKDLLRKIYKRNEEEKTDTEDDYSYIYYPVQEYSDNSAVIEIGQAYIYNDINDTDQNDYFKNV